MAKKTLSLSKVVGIHTKPHLGAEIEIRVEPNENGYNGIALAAYFEGSQFGWIFQAERFKEVGYKSIIDIVDEAGEALTGFTATIIGYDTADNGRQYAKIEFYAPEGEKGKTTMKKASTNETAKEVVYTVSQGRRKDLTEEQYAARKCSSIASPTTDKPIPAKLKQAADGRIAVSVTFEEKGVAYKDVIVGYIDDEVASLSTSLPSEPLSGSAIWNLVSKRGYTAHLIGQDKLIHQIIKVELEPDEAKEKAHEALKSLGLTPSQIVAKERYLTAQGFNDNDLTNFWTVYNTIHQKYGYAVYQPEDDRYTYISSGGAESEIKLLLKSFFKTVGTIIVGPPAAGKDEAINTLARLLNIRVVRQVADANMDADVLIGMQGIVNDNGVGVTQFQPSVLMECLYQDPKAGKPLTLFVLDEANMANPDQFVVLNELLNLNWDIPTITGEETPDGQLVSFTRGGDRMVSPWFRMLLTMNVDLEGCKSFNQATWSRMDTIVFGQNVSMKDILLREFPKLPTKDAVMADRLWGAIKTQAKNAGEDEVNEVGPRNFKSAARDCLLFGTSMRDALREWVVTKLQVSETREAMEKILSSY